MTPSQITYYRRNKTYSKFLSQATPHDFQIYLSEIVCYLQPGQKYLDVGCGPGLVVDYLNRKGINAYGIEVSMPSITLAKKIRRGKYRSYSGTRIPYKSETFHLVGSWNVIEHVDNVELFLTESLRVLKSGGYLIIGAPNFLSLTSSYHYRTVGLRRKISNLILTVEKLIRYTFTDQVSFSKFPPISRKEFQPDDDAVNLINPLDVFKWGQTRHLKLKKYWGAISPNYLSYYLKSVPGINLMTGGVLIVFQKP